MRVIDMAKLVAAGAVAFVVGAAGTARAEEPKLFAWPLQAPPVDVGSYPAITPQGLGRPPGIELHGFVSAWWTPWSEPSPAQAHDAFRLRFAVLRLDARVMKNVSVLARVGFMVPGSPLLDFAATWQPNDAFGITAGQFRLPIGAAATTLAPMLVMMDRPGYVYAMTKLAFRDTGVMIHSGPRGIGDGLFHYRLVAASGAGRFGAGADRPPAALGEYLFAARGIFDPGRLFLGKGGRFALGVSYVRSHDPAIDTGDAAADKETAANVLGRTLAPIEKERDTQLVGGDLTFSYRGVWTQAEALYMSSRATDGSVRRKALGASLELAYTLPVRPFHVDGIQLAARGERFDPNLDTPGDEQRILSVGVNVNPTSNVRASLFGSETFFHDPKRRASRHAGEVGLRFNVMF